MYRIGKLHDGYLGRVNL